MVPEARLELAHLAAEDFESSASTVPPLGPSGDVFSRLRLRRQSQLISAERVAILDQTAFGTTRKPARTLL
jgi:hypothetical protein